MGELYALDEYVTDEEASGYEEERIAGSSQFTLTRWMDSELDGAEGYDLLLRIPLRKRDLLAIMENVPEHLHLVALDEDGFLYWENR